MQQLRLFFARNHKY